MIQEKERGKEKERGRKRKRTKKREGKKEKNYHMNVNVYAVERGVFSHCQV